MRLLAGSLIAFIVWSGLVAAGWFDAADEAAHDVLEADGSRPFWGLVTHAGDTVVVFSVVLILAGIIASRGRLRAGGALVMALFVTAVLVTLLKAWVERDRPDVLEPGWSYPSGHAALSLVAYGGAAQALGLPRRGAIALVSFAVLIAVSRVALGVHWLSDIAGSALLAAAILLAVEMVFPHEDAADVAEDVVVEEGMRASLDAEE